IIENYRALKESLMADGHTFDSDTDTEVLAKLIGTKYDGDLPAAVRSALSLVMGTYGLAVMSADKPGEMVVARLGSPIVLGLGVDGNFVASDPSALLAHTKDVIYLDDSEMAVIRQGEYQIISANGQLSSKSPEVIEWDLEAVKKQGYPHFMLKEAFEAAEVVKNPIRGRLIPENGKAKLGGLEE